ncbi:hypothetical protein CRPA23_23110 [Pseudomonas aeruginosa]
MEASLSDRKCQALRGKWLSEGGLHDCSETKGDCLKPQGMNARTIARSNHTKHIAAPRNKATTFY